MTNSKTYSAFKFSDKHGNTLTGYHTGASGDSDKPPVIFVTAIGLSNKISKRLADLLSDTYQVYTWDMRGLPGDGELSDDDYDTKTYVDELMSLAEHIDRGAVRVIGYCSGCQIATMFSYYYPEFVEKTLLLNGHYNIDGLGELPARAAMGMAVRKVLTSSENTDDFLRLFIATSFEKDVLGNMEPDLRECIKSKSFESPAGLKVYFKMLNAFRENTLVQMADDINSKLVLFGSENDHMCSPQQSVEFSKRLSNSTCKIFPELDHFAIFTDSDFRNHVKEQLAE